MVQAFPTDEKGNQSGPIKSFSDEHWGRLKTLKPFRWGVVETNVKKSVVELMPQPIEDIKKEIVVPEVNESKRRNGRRNQKRK